MAICLDYQSVYTRPAERVVSVRLQFGAGLLLILALTLKVWVKLESVDLGYKLAEQRQMLLALDMERRELELERSVLLRPDALQARARAELGLRNVSAQNAIEVSY